MKTTRLATPVRALITWLAAIVVVALAGVIAPRPVQAVTWELSTSVSTRFPVGPVCSRLDQNSGAVSYPFKWTLRPRGHSVTDPRVRSAVGAVQHLLRRIRYTGTSGTLLGVDGTFGSQTAHAVRAFQRDYGLKIDGKVGPQTWTALAREACDYSSARSPGRDATMTAVLTKTEAQRALGLRLGHKVVRFSGCHIKEGPMAWFCSRVWRLPSGGDISTGVAYANTAKEAMSLFPVWSLPDHADQLIESTPTLFIAAHRYEDRRVDVTADQLDRRMVISSSCTRDDGDVAAATTCARRLLAAQKAKADTFMDSRL